MADLTVKVHCLRRIDKWPIDLTDLFFARYPTMKLGVEEDAWHYADQLLPTVQKIVEDAPEITDWVATAPHQMVLPAAANLLCERVADRMQPHLPPDCRLVPVDVIDHSPGQSGIDAVEFRHYCAMSLKDREDLQRRRTYSPNPADFVGRGVLYINDINVTGTQMRFVREALTALRPLAIHFVYLIDCDPRVGQSHPELEAAINGFEQLTPEALALILRRPDLRHTAKCLSSIISLPIDRVEGTASLLDAATRTRLCALYRTEGRYAGPGFAERLRVIEGKTT